MEKLTRQGFDAIFEKCMTKDEYPIPNLDENGIVSYSFEKVEPCMIVKEFSSDYSECEEHEFTDNDDAWNFFQPSQCHLWLEDATGSIYFER